MGSDRSRERDWERERGDGDRRGDRVRSGFGVGALLTDVGVCDRVRDLPREGDMVSILESGARLVEESRRRCDDWKWWLLRHDHANNEYLVYPTLA